MKGILTSEFWLTIAYLITAILLYYLKAPQDLILALAVPVTGYAVGRGVSKINGVKR